MASAILQSRNELYWGDRKVYMRKYTNNSNNNPHLNKFNPNPNLNPNQNPDPDPNPNPNPISSRRIHDFSSAAYVWPSDEPRRQKAAPPSASDDLSSRYRKAVALSDQRESSHGDYVTFNLAAYTRAELKELKKRLISELQQVRRLRSRIESREVESRTNCPASQFSGSYGRGREVASITRPLPLQLNYALESLGSAASKEKEKRTPNANQYYPSNEFLTGKNKMVPPSAKEKVSGNKRALHFPSGRGSKRPAVLDSQVDKLVTSIMRRCRQILTKLMKDKHGWVFNTPVDTVALGLHDYHQIIKHPMDLGTVMSRLDKDEYRSPLDFASDVRLTFSNAMTYNSKGQDVYIMAELLLSRFEEMFNPAYKKFEAEHRRVVGADQMNQNTWAPPQAPALVAENVRRPANDSVLITKKSDSTLVQSTLLNSSLVQVQTPTVPAAVMASQSAKSVVTPRSIPKLPKPRASDPNKRQMSFEEKAKLGMSLQNLPQEKMDQFLKIIKKRNPQLAEDGDEVELDIGALDNETLWELDRFVSYHKKAVSKIMRQGLMEMAQKNMLPASGPMPEAVLKNKKGEAGEEDVDIGDEIPVNNFPPVEIEKDAACASSQSSSSSSSSSSSDSSSSSGSSSGSDSDADSVQSPIVESKEAGEVEPFLMKS